MRGRKNWFLDLESPLTLPSDWASAKREISKTKPTSKLWHNLIQKQRELKDFIKKGFDLARRGEEERGRREEEKRGKSITT